MAALDPLRVYLGGTAYHKPPVLTCDEPPPEYPDPSPSADSIPMSDFDYANPAYQKSVLDAAFNGQQCEYSDHADSDGGWQDGDFQDIAWAVGTAHKVRVKPTEPTPDPYTALKVAYAAGRVIEAFSEIGGWIDIGCPNWDLPAIAYRVRPEPITVPLLPEDWFGGWFVRLKSLPETKRWMNCVAVIGIADDEISVANPHIECGTKTRRFTHREAADLLERTLDGKTFHPCSKTVEQ